MTYFSQDNECWYPRINCNYGRGPLVLGEGWGSLTIIKTPGSRLRIISTLSVRTFKLQEKLSKRKLVPDTDPTLFVHGSHVLSSVLESQHVQGLVEDSHSWRTVKRSHTEELSGIKSRQELDANVCLHTKKILLYKDRNPGALKYNVVKRGSMTLKFRRLRQQ